MRTIFMMLSLALSFGVTAQAQLKDLPPRAYQTADGVWVSEEPADEKPREPLEPAEQRTRLLRAVDAVTEADDERARLRAHADLLDQVDDLPLALRYAVSRSNGDAVLRAIAIWALGERGTPAACSLVSDAYVDRNEPLSTLADAVARGRCGDTSALRQVLASGSELTRARAAVTLGVLGEDRARAQIQTRADEAAEEWKADYNLALGLLGDPRQSEALHEMLSDRERHLHAAIALSRMGVDYVVYDLQAATLSRESLLRWASARELTSKRLPGTCEVLVGLVDDGDQRVVELSDGVITAWHDAAEAHWLREGFNMDHFNARAYCP